MEHPENESRSGGEQNHSKPDDEVSYSLRSKDTGAGMRVREYMDSANKNNMGIGVWGDTTHISVL